MARTQHLRTSTTVLAVSVVMGAAVLPVGPAFADDIGELATSTFSYSSVDTTSGVIVGGVGVVSSEKSLTAGDVTDLLHSAHRR